MTEPHTQRIRASKSDCPDCRAAGRRCRACRLAVRRARHEKRKATDPKYAEQRRAYKRALARDTRAANLAKGLTWDGKSRATPAPKPAEAPKPKKAHGPRPSCVRRSPDAPPLERKLPDKPEREPRPRCLICWAIVKTGRYCGRHEGRGDTPPGNDLAPYAKRIAKY